MWQRLTKKISERAVSYLELYQLEAIERTHGFISGSFFKTRNVIGVVAVVSLSILTIIALVTPPKSIVGKIQAKPETYYQFRDGMIWFGSRVGNQESKVTEFPVSLPFREIAKLEGYDPRNIHYRFLVDIPQSSFSPKSMGLLIPKIWGKSVVKVNGVVSDFGENIFTVLPLLSHKNIVEIEVDVSNSIFKSPISATFPLVVAKKEKLHDLVAIVDEQVQTSSRAIALYSLAIVLFGMLFIAYPKKPELLAFVSLLGCTLLNTLVVEQLEKKNILFMGGWAEQQSVILLLDLAVNSATLAFSLFFLRAHPKTVFLNLKNSVLISGTIGLSFSYFLFKAVNATHFPQVSHVVLNGLYFLFLVSSCGPRLIYLSTQKSVPVARKLAALFIVGSIGAVYCINIADYFKLISTLTNIYSNGLILNLTLSVIVAYEISRAEVNQQILGSLLPKEVRESLQFNLRGSDKSGFILLVDAVGYAANRSRFEDVDIRSSYIEALAQKILRPVHELGIIDFSILNCTGDGLYCAIRGEPTTENYSRVLGLAEKITASSSDEKILFRAAIGYGNYGVRIIEYGNIRKEFVAGNVLNDLSRIIGSDKGKTSIRVLMDQSIQSLVGVAPSGSVLDKHGFRHEYFEIEEKKNAA